MTAISGQRCSELLKIQTRWLLRRIQALLSRRRGIQQVFLDLEGEGYETQAFIIQLVPSMRRIEIGCGLLQKSRLAMTPKASDGIMGTPRTKTDRQNVNTLGLSDVSPNTKSRDYKGENTAGDGCAGRRNKIHLGR